MCYGIQFTLPPRYADGPTARYVTHMFDMRCEENGIEHRLTKVKHPWTNGQVERMNRTIKDATVRRYHYDTHQQLETNLADFIALQLRQAAQDATRPHALRVHLQNMDRSASALHLKPAPPYRGTKHLVCPIGCRDEANAAHQTFPVKPGGQDGPRGAVRAGVCEGAAELATGFR